MRIFAALAVGTLLASCGSILGPNEELVIGTVAHYDDPVIIEVPDTVVSSVPFAVTVRTYGGGCERQGPTETSVEGQVTVVTPFDYTPTGDDVACMDILKTFDHEASLELGTKGVATLVVRGRQEPGDVVIDYTFSVWVR